MFGKKKVCDLSYTEETEGETHDEEFTVSHSICNEGMHAIAV